MNRVNSTNSPDSLKTAVVTGGAGFIGSHLAEELSRRPFRVIILDDLSTGRRSSIDHLSRGTIAFIEGSVTDPELLRKTLQLSD